MDLLFKNKKICKHFTIFKIPQLHFYVGVINVWSLRCLLWYDFVFSFRKHCHPVVEPNKPIIKILFKKTSDPQNCGSSVKVNRISDGILEFYVEQCQKCLVYKEENAINMQNRGLSEVSDGMVHIIIVMWTEDHTLCRQHRFFVVTCDNLVRVLYFHPNAH